MSTDPCFDAAPNLKEFRDTRLWVQYAMGGIAGAGLVGAITLFRKAGGEPVLQAAAGGALAATLVALAVVYLKFAKPVVLRQTASGIERICGDSVASIPYEELFGLRAKWTDVLRNGVYHHTLVRLAFSSQNPVVPVLTYDSTVDYDTLKYHQMHEFQCEVAEVVARRMAQVMQSDGYVKWTEKLSIRPDGIEMTKKAGSAPEVIGFERISQWKLDEGLFKLGIDGSRRPVLVEDTSQWNFYPGLLLFSQLCQPLCDDASLDEVPALIS
jgi:hypothetical protein